MYEQPDSFNTGHLQGPAEEEMVIEPSDWIFPIIASFLFSYWLLMSND